MPFAEHLEPSNGLVDPKAPPAYKSTLSEDLDSKSAGIDFENVKDIRHEKVQNDVDLSRYIILNRRPRRKLWIAVCLVILCLIGAAVTLGVVLGVRRMARPSSNSSDHSTTTINGGFQHITIAVNTSLAAFNWTDTSDVPHYRVIFQHTSNSIWQAERTSESQSWTVSRVEGAGSVMPRTPLVAVGGFPDTAFVSLPKR